LEFGCASWYNDAHSKNKQWFYQAIKSLFWIYNFDSNTISTNKCCRTFLYRAIFYCKITHTFGPSLFSSEICGCFRIYHDIWYCFIWQCLINTESLQCRTIQSLIRAKVTWQTNSFVCLYITVSDKLRWQTKKKDFIGCFINSELH
jgi:hypothetical protein